MLVRLLEHIETGQAHGVKELSEKLGVSAAMIEALLSELERAGYLRRVGPAGEPGCQACHERSGCVINNFNGWIRTEKSRAN